MGLFSFLFKSLKDENICTDKNSEYYGYPNDLKAWCENQDKYSNTWKKYAKYREKINNYYSNFINNGFKSSDLTELENYCDKYLDLIPDIIKSLQEEKKINNDKNMIINEQSYYSFVYKKLALAYEKQGNYQKAIDICQKSISNGVTDDGTKSGFSGRIEKLQNKLK